MSTSGTIEFPIDQTQRRVEVIKANSPGFMLAARNLQKELRLYRSKTDQEEKDRINSADFKMGQFLIEFFQKAFPKDALLVEDMDAIDGSTGFRWVIDPIDGSMNFVRGLPMYAISIGLEYREGPVAGVVLVPELEDIYSAIYGEGATKNGDTIFPSSTNELSRSIFAPNLPSKRSHNIPEIMADLTALVTYARSIRRSGSLVLDLCWIAEGCLDGVWEKTVKHWDMCATSVILAEAGGKVTDYEGKHYLNGLPEIVATNGFLHNSILEVLKNAKSSLGRN